MSRLHHELIISDRFYVKVNREDAFISEEEKDLVESNIVDFINSSEFLPCPGNIVRGVSIDENKESYNLFTIENLPQVEITGGGDVVFSFEIRLK